MDTWIYSYIVKIVPRGKTSKGGNKMLQIHMDKIYVTNSFPKRQKELQAYLEEQGWILAHFNFDLKNHLEVIVLGIVGITTLPVIIKVITHRSKKA